MMMMLSLRKFLLLLLAFVHAANGFVIVPPSATTTASLLLRSASSTDIVVGGVCSDALTSALRKMSKTLAVSLEVVPDGSDVTALSMQLRKLKASTLWTNHVETAIGLTKEQETAQGNFPGPCPVIYTGNQPEEAIRGGVKTIVLPTDTGIVPDTSDIDVIWKVESVEDVQSVQGNAFVVYVDGRSDAIDRVLESIPKGSVVVAAIDSMQDDNAELEQSRQLQDKGTTAILLRNACVGDNEDIEYATFVIDGLTKKKSSTFNLTGLTGSTNGHFGGVATSTSTTWRRQQV